MANSVDPNQTAPIGAVCSGSTVFASILNLSVMLGKYLQMKFSDAFFSWRFRAFFSNFGKRPLAKLGEKMIDLTSNWEKIMT